MCIDSHSRIRRDSGPEPHYALNLTLTDITFLSLITQCDCRRWMSQSPSFCDHPFVLTAASKALIMHLDAVQQMRRAAQAEYADLNRIMARGQRPSPYLILNVTRSNVVHDTLEQVGTRVRGVGSDRT